jgi:hypothetical protein
MKHCQSPIFDQTGRFGSRRPGSHETPLGRNSEKIERRTSNFQHRTSNIDDAALYLILKQANCSLRRTRPNRISKDRFARAAQALAPHVAQSFFKLTEFIIRCWTFNVRCSSVSFSIKLAASQASSAAYKQNGRSLCDARINHLKADTTRHLRCKGRFQHALQVKLQALSHGLDHLAGISCQLFGIGL